MSEENERTEQPDPASGEPGRALAPMFTEGGRPGPGRRKGVPNRTTLVMRDAIAAVFEDLQATAKGKGRYPHFLAWAKRHPTEFYRIAVRQVPMPLENMGQAIGLVVFRGLNDEA
jgi:hypothetical protein